ncbi:MAG: trypsin-like serine protease [Proteobacteria bacterium]|nr:MAG: trypsin-like serine protease [Pseudomonadota bacterium]
MSRFSLVALFLLALHLSKFATAAINCPGDSKNEFKSVVKIIREYGDEDRHCTGTVLKGGCFILTAGHCVECKEAKGKACLPSKFKIKSGVHSNHDLGKVSDVYLDNDFVMFEKNDVALLKLTKCTDDGMEIDFTPLDSSQEVSVGGYGVIKLNSFTSQPTRHMGKNKVVKFDRQKLCLGEVIVDADSKTVIGGSKNCQPVGQDSGSPLVQKNHVYGVYISNVQTWRDDGTTKTQGCYANLRDPNIKSFIEETLSLSKASTNKNQDSRNNPAVR